MVKLLCIVDYHSKFSIEKRVNSLSVDDLVQMTKLISADYVLLKKTVSNAGTHFISETFKDFYRKQSIHHPTTKATDR